MIKIEVTNKTRKHINDNHREYIKLTSVPKLEEKIKGIRKVKKRELLKKLFGDTQGKRETSIIKFCLSADLRGILQTFDATFSEVYGFKFSDTSTEEHKKIINNTCKDLDEILNYDGFNKGKKLESGKKLFMLI